MNDIMKEASEAKMRGDYPTALRLRLGIEEDFTRVGASPVERAKNLNYIAFLAVCVGDLAEAEQAARKCFELYRVAANDQDEKYATYLMMLSCVLAESGQFEEAVLHGEKALALFIELQGEDNSYVVYRRRDLQQMRDHKVRHYLERR